MLGCYDPSSPKIGSRFLVLSGKKHKTQSDLLLVVFFPQHLKKKKKRGYVSFFLYLFFAVWDLNLGSQSC
jgi:hypothetical protein